MTDVDHGKKRVLEKDKSDNEPDKKRTARVVTDCIKEEDKRGGNEFVEVKYENKLFEFKEISDEDAKDLTSERLMEYWPFLKGKKDVADIIMEGWAACRESEDPDGDPC